MLTVIIYAILFFVAFVLLFLVDQDNSHVTSMEWTLYGMMLLSAYGMFKTLVKMHKDEG